MDGQPAGAGEEAERAAYRERLREHLKDPAFRAIEGFPLGDDEAILALSDPPYYTACPNPFLPEIIAGWQAERARLRAELGLPDDSGDNGNGGTDSPPGEGPGVGVYRREPFAADVSEGKSDPIYNAHSYHTKVPHKAIMRYILHYTDPGDIVFDGFCGSGMTGVAAQLCGDRRAVEELGYQVRGGIVYDGERVISRLGARKAVLVDLSPAATFIAYNYNTPADAAAYEREMRRILRELRHELGWMYETWHPHCDDPLRVKATIDYVVWSEVFRCAACGGEVVFLDQALDLETQRVRGSFPCPHCAAQLDKSKLEKSLQVTYDPVLGRTVQTPQRKPVLIAYRAAGRKQTKRVDQADIELLARIEALRAPAGLVRDELPFMHMTHQRAKMAQQGVTHLHHFFLPRAQHALATLWAKASAVPDARLRALLLFTVEQAIWTMTIMDAYRPAGFSQVSQYMKGIYYVPSQISEVSPWYVLDGKRGRLARVCRALAIHRGNVAVATQSACVQAPAEGCVDYIFTDPPFGENIYYADLNYLVESWHRVWTNSGPEAIIDRAKGKDLRDYQELMRQAFAAYYRWLKPGRWMTVEFHNSHNAVWNAIQEAMLAAGFVVADVRTLDKQQASYRQVTASSAAKQDLVISAYRPRAGFERRFLAEAGSPEGAWDFVRQHLAQVPVVVRGKGGLEVVAERQAYLLYDRMVAFHIQRGATVPLSAAEFYAGLRERFAERDGMYFLPAQLDEYERARLEAGQVSQLALFVSDEKSAIQWLRQQLDPALGGYPQTYQEIQPAFLQQLHQARHEELPELSEMLEHNFLKDAAGRWYVPDPNQAADLEKLRQKELLRQFAEYAGSSGRLRQVRTEAVRAGFADALKRRDYAVIVRVAERLPEAVLQEDAELLMYYDSATLRVK